MDCKLVQQIVSTNLSIVSEIPDYISQHIHHCEVCAQYTADLLTVADESTICQWCSMYIPLIRNDAEPNPVFLPVIRILLHHFHRCKTCQDGADYQDFMLRLIAALQDSSLQDKEIEHIKEKIDAKLGQMELAEILFKDTTIN